MYGDFVGMHGWSGGWRRGAAECLVVNKLGDSWVLATERALGVAPQLEFAELHLERIEKEQAVEERSALAEDKFQNLGRLDESDHAGQHAEHAPLRAARDGAGRRGFGIEAAIARPAQVRREDAGLDRKSTRLNSSHRCISYAVFCLKK